VPQPFFFFLRREGLRSQKPGTKEVESSGQGGDGGMGADAQSFRQFAETQYQFGRWLRQPRDRARQQPRVTTAQVALTLIAQVFFALRSLLRVDQWLRTPMARAWLNVAAHAPRGSDTTLLRVVGAWERGRLRQAT